MFQQTQTKPHWGQIEYCRQCNEPFCAECRQSEWLDFCSEACEKAYEKEQNDN